MARDSSEVEWQEGGEVQTQTAGPQAGGPARRPTLHAHPATDGHAEGKRGFCASDLY